MRVTIREDTHPDCEFYYDQQFKIYHESCLIWDQETWETVLTTCGVYRIEIDGRYGGDVILQDGEKGEKYIVDFSILPDYQRMGVGRCVLGHIKKMTKKLTAVTRKETLPFFLKSGFVVRETIKNYYERGVNGFYIVFERRSEK